MLGGTLFSTSHWSGFSSEMKEDEMIVRTKYSKASGTATVDYYNDGQLSVKRYQTKGWIFSEYPTGERYTVMEATIDMCDTSVIESLYYDIVEDSLPLTATKTTTENSIKYNVKQITNSGVLNINFVMGTDEKLQNVMFSYGPENGDAVDEQYISNYTLEVQTPSDFDIADFENADISSMYGQLVLSGKFTNISHWSGFEGEYSESGKGTQEFMYSKSNNSGVLTETSASSTKYEYFDGTKEYRKTVVGGTPEYSSTQNSDWETELPIFFDSVFESMRNIDSFISFNADYSYEIKVSGDLGEVDSTAEFTFEFDVNGVLTALSMRGYNDAELDAQLTMANYTQSVTAPSWFNASDYQ